MRVTARMDPSVIRALSQAQAEAMTMTAQQMLNEVRNDAVMPFDTGNLQNESTYVDDSKVRIGKVKIVHDTPYARRLYFHPEYNFNTSKNANAGGEWWETWLSGDKKSRPQELFKKFFRRQSGGSVR